MGPSAGSHVGGILAGLGRARGNEVRMGEPRLWAKSLLACAKESDVATGVFQVHHRAKFLDGGVLFKDRTSILCK